MINIRPILVFLPLFAFWLLGAGAIYLPGVGISGQGGDLSALFIAGRALATGQPELVYLSPLWSCGGTIPPDWAGLASDVSIEQKAPLIYLYPPIWAWLVTPLTDMVSAESFGKAVLVAQLAMLGVFPWMGVQLCNLSNREKLVWIPAGFLFLLCTLPFQSALFFNQLQITVTFLTLASLLSYRRGLFVWAGVLLGLAAAIKITPALFGLIFLLDRNWRAAIVSTFTGLAVLAISILATGYDLHAMMFQTLQSAAQSPPLTSLHWSLEAMLMEVHIAFSSLPYPKGLAEGFAVPDIPRWVQAAPRVATLIALCFLGWQSLRAKGHDTVAARAFCLGLILAVLGPMGWAHYFMLPIALLPMWSRILTPAKTLLMAILYFVTLNIPTLDLLREIPTTLQPTVLVPGLFLLGTLLLALLLFPRRTKS